MEVVLLMITIIMAGILAGVGFLVLLAWVSAKSDGYRDADQ